MNAAQALEACAEFMMSSGNCCFQWLSISVTEVPINSSFLRASRRPLFAETICRNDANE
jgi:hypothetical protein